MCNGPHDYIPIENVARIETFFTTNSQLKYENVYHAFSPGGYGSGNLVQVAECVDNWVVGTLLLHLGSQVLFTGTKATDLTSESAPVYEIAHAVPVAGAIGSGEVYPAQVAACISWITGQRGRSYRGRTYVPGMRTLMGAGDGLTSTWQDNYAADFTDLKESLASSGFTLVIASLCNGKAWRTTGTYAAVTSLKVNPIYATQRRRLPGRGT